MALNGPARSAFETDPLDDLLVAFTRHAGALGVTTNPYLRTSTFRLDLGADLGWGDARFSHPSGFGNLLVFDGETVTTGARQSYHAAGCPAQPT